MPAGGLPETDRLILMAATGERRLSLDELRRILEHVARAGFHPTELERARTTAAGVVWEGRTVRRNDFLPPEVAHYLRHVVKVPQWPIGTTREQYVESLRQVILDPLSGVVVSRFRDFGWQLAVVRQSGPLRGPAGDEWVMVEYRLRVGHWVTGFQFPPDPHGFFRQPDREGAQWLRELA